jgi:DNA-binding response OmpR family regulator
VLVANGYRDAADVLALLLRVWGYEARVAYTGPTALAEATRYQPDVVVADLILPDLDGFQLADRLRGQAALIALTGLWHETVRRRAFESGFDHVFLKPADPEELHAVLEGGSAGGQALRVDSAHRDWPRVVSAAMEQGLEAGQPSSSTRVPQDRR